VEKVGESGLIAVHIGNIELDGKTEFLITKGSRKEVLYELNNWIFDYFKLNNQKILQLPPLDDWVWMNVKQNHLIYKFDEDFVVSLSVQFIEAK
jgi:hypothetical protein